MRSECPSALALVCAAGVAAAPAVDVGASWKSFFLAMDWPEYGDARIAEQDMSGACIQRLRVHGGVSAGNLRFETAWELSARVQDPLLFVNPTGLLTTEAPSHRPVDFDELLYPGRAGSTTVFGVLHNLDRLAVTWRLDCADLIVGRQAIARGSARMVNSTDVFAPRGFDDLDSEYRRGIDAARVRIPLGMLSEIDAGYVPAEEGDPWESSGFIRGKGYAWETDVSVLGAKVARHVLAGIDIARSVGGAGAWIEASYLFAEAGGGEEAEPEDNFGRASLGIDYRFNDTLYGFAEYHYSGAGTGGNPALHKLPGAARDAGVFLWGRHYAGVGATCRRFRLAPVTVLLMLNLNDPSLYVSPRVEYNIAEDIYLEAGAAVGAGESPRAPAANRSEFGSCPDFYFTSFRVYF